MPEPVAVVTAPGVAAAWVAEPGDGESGPVTSAAVPPAARTADSSEAASTDAIRPRAGGRSAAAPSADGLNAVGSAAGFVASGSGTSKRTGSSGVVDGLKSNIGFSGRALGSRGLAICVQYSARA